MLPAGRDDHFVDTYIVPPVVRWLRYSRRKPSLAKHIRIFLQKHQSATPFLGPSIWKVSFQSYFDFVGHHQLLNPFKSKDQQSILLMWTWSIPVTLKQPAARTLSRVFLFLGGRGRLLHAHRISCQRFPFVEI